MGSQGEQQVRGWPGLPAEAQGWCHPHPLHPRQQRRHQRGRTQGGRGPRDGGLGLHTRYLLSSLGSFPPLSSIVWSVPPLASSHPAGIFHSSWAKYTIILDKLSQDNSPVSPAGIIAIILAWSDTELYCSLS